MLKKATLLVTLVFSITASAASEDLPEPLRGTWVVRRVIPTATISCWGKRESKSLIGTRIQYSVRGFRWKNIQTDSPEVTIVRLTADQFHDENSGGGASDSQVTLKHLGIEKPDVKQVSLSHPDATITGATTEIPGDRVLMKDSNRIVFSVCNVWFEAEREPQLKEH